MSGKYARLNSEIFQTWELPEQKCKKHFEYGSLEVVAMDTYQFNWACDLPSAAYIKV